MPAEGGGEVAGEEGLVLCGITVSGKDLGVEKPGEECLGTICCEARARS
jgi:hypothetical protein